MTVEHNSASMANGTEPQSVTANAESKAESKSRCNCLKKASNAMIHGMEKGFYKMGCVIGKYPWAFMLGAVVFVIIMVPGALLFLEEEEDSSNLWVPLGSQAIDDKAFVEMNFPSYSRFQGMIIEDGDNVLTPAVLQGMLDIDIAIKALSDTGENAYDWNSLCYKVGANCLSNSLLELWSFDEPTIRGLSQSDILNTINSVTVSPVYFNQYDVTSMLGDIERDGSNNIISAKATRMSYVLKLDNPTTIAAEPDEILSWELDFIDIGAAGHNSIDNVYYFAGRSFADEGGTAISGDLLFLFAGFGIVIVFSCLVLGRFSHVHQRIWVVIGGLCCIGMSIGVSYGFCSYIGLKYGPVHSILPFLFLGIGIDDMFVICQSLDSLPPQTADLPIHERIGLTLRHAGVAITITSLTDVLAFAVGATTILPALRSFCGFAAVGILAIFIFQIMFLAGCLTYDLKRRDGTRNACCCCYVHKDYQPNPCTEKGVVQKIFDNHYGKFLIKLPVKIVITIISLGLLAVCIWGTINLKQDFDFTWFLPSDSYPTQYFKTSDEYFPQSGVPSNVYFSSDIDYYADYTTLEAMHVAIKADEYVTSSSVDSWYYSYRQWLLTVSDAAVTPLLDPTTKYPLTEADFYNILSTKYLVGDGFRFQQHIKTETDNTIKASRLSFTHKNLDSAQEEVKAMDSVRKLVEDYNYPIDDCFAYSEFYLNFESNKVIQQELYRNLGLAFLCVFIMTLFLLADIVACLFVSLCVIMTLVDVGGCMFFWGLTIDTVTSINLIIAIGLTVDYSAHIAHAFMVCSGDRHDRVKGCMSAMGPAVFYGGFSTFLAFLLLVASTSYVFTVFFKIFFLVVLFGMFHGMMFLPVLLSWIGPPSYATLEIQNETQPGTGHTVENGASETKKPNGKSQSPQTDGYNNPALDMEMEINVPNNKVVPTET